MQTGREASRGAAENPGAYSKERRSGKEKTRRAFVSLFLAKQRE